MRYTRLLMEQLSSHRGHGAATERDALAKAAHTHVAAARARGARQEVALAELRRPVRAERAVRAAADGILVDAGAVRE